MHLDTYFNVIDKDLCTMCFNRYDTADAGDINYLTMDMYVRTPGLTAYHRDTNHYANSGPAIDARHIMSVAGQSKILEEEHDPGDESRQIILNFARYEKILPALYRCFRIGILQQS